MSSLVPCFEYDIFISYRQKDNKGGRWVSEFVDALKTELESTFKEEVSVYFDINPHDGLLEMHDVDASLKDKLKCLVFIPIISRTYCDPKSFAWEHEFKAFVEEASKDQFGLKIKLPNGNVASRVLPVRIHDLDNADIKLCESVLGGILRGIEFIYKESGIDKPLAPEDDEKKNLNNTKYRIQIIKVAHAIKEIILGMKTEPVEIIKAKDHAKESIKGVSEDERKINLEKPAKAGKRKVISIVALVAILVVAAIFAYPKLFKKNTIEKLRSSGESISVAVMPFQNLTNDTLWNVWQSGIQNELIASLSSSPDELKVRQIESVKNLLNSKGVTNYASITPDIAGIVSRKLDANVFISGSINQAGATIRLNARLINSKTEEVFKSFQVDGNSENILHIIDSLSVMVKNALIITRLEKRMSQDYRHILSTDSPEAYRYFIYGENAFNEEDYPAAIKLDSQALAIDTNFIQTAIKISVAYNNMEIYKEAKRWFLRVNSKKDQLPMWGKIILNRLHAMLYETPYDEIKYHRQLLEFDDQLPNAYYGIGLDYFQLYQFDKAVAEFEKVLEIYNKWGTKPSWANDYSVLEYAYYKTGQKKKLEKLSKKAEHDFPDDFLINGAQVCISLIIERDTIKGNKYTAKCKSILRDKKLSDAEIASNLGLLFSRVDLPDKAEKYYRQALVMEPGNPLKMNALAYLLIDKDRNIKEGMELVSKALEITPDYYDYLHTRGWGLYKQKKCNEALEILQKSWDLRMKNAIYDHEAFLHLEAAKKAVAGQIKTIGDRINSH
jgi:tetratricopeptide (TPR) repeat protein